MKGKTAFLLFVSECCQVVVQNEIVRGVEELLNLRNSTKFKN